MKSKKSIVITIVVVATLVMTAAVWLYQNNNGQATHDKLAQGSVESRQYFVTSFGVGESALNGWQEAEVARAISGVSTSAEISVVGGSNGGEGLENDRVKNVVEFIRRLTPSANIKIEPSVNHFRGAMVIVDQIPANRHQYYVVDFAVGMAGLSQYHASDINDMLSKIPFMSELVITGSITDGETDNVANERAANVMSYIQALRPQSKMTIEPRKKGETNFRGVVLSVVGSAEKTAEKSLVTQTITARVEKPAQAVQEIPKATVQVVKAKVVEADKIDSPWWAETKKFIAQWWIVGTLCLIGIAGWLLRHGIANLCRNFHHYLLRKRNEKADAAEEKIRLAYDDAQRQKELSAYTKYDRPIFFETADQGVLAVTVKKNSGAAFFLPPFSFRDDGKIISCNETSLSRQMTDFVNRSVKIEDESRDLWFVDFAIMDGTIYVPMGEEANKAQEWLENHLLEKEEKAARIQTSSSSVVVSEPVNVPPVEESTEKSGQPVASLDDLLGGLGDFSAVLPQQGDRKTSTPEQ